MRKRTSAALMGLAVYLGGVSINPHSYASMSHDLRGLASTPNRAPEITRQSALELAERFDAKETQLKGWNPQALIPFLDIFSGDSFRYLSAVNNLTPEAKKYGLPLGR